MKAVFDRERQIDWLEMCGRDVLGQERHENRSRSGKSGKVKESGSKVSKISFF